MACASRKDSDKTVRLYRLVSIIPITYVLSTIFVCHVSAAEAESGWI